MDERSIRVLLVEKNLEDARSLRDLAARSGFSYFEFALAQGLDEAVKRVRAENFEAVLLDLELPDSRGLETFKNFHQQFPELPVVVLSDLDDNDLALNAVKNGAQDYLVKNEVTASLLARSIRYAIERHWLRNVMRSLLFIDELTGLYNRRGFSTLAEQHLKLARRTQKGLLLVFADLDGLKEINDKLGHSAGDQALKATADVLRKTFRESDIIARAGGDEFTVLAIDAPDNSSEAITTRLQKSLSEFNGEPGRAFKISLSYGVSHFHPQDHSTVQELMDRADAEMYQHKLRIHRTTP